MSLDYREENEEGIEEGINIESKEYFLRRMEKIGEALLIADAQRSEHWRSNQHPGGEPFSLEELNNYANSFDTRALNDQINQLGVELTAGKKQLIDYAGTRELIRIARSLTRDESLKGYILGLGKPVSTRVQAVRILRSALKVYPTDRFRGKPVLDFGGLIILANLATARKLPLDNQRERVKCKYG